VYYFLLTFFVIWENSRYWQYFRALTFSAIVKERSSFALGMPELMFLPVSSHRLKKKADHISTLKRRIQMSQLNQKKARDQIMTE
jgi:hypothetical protein